MPQGLEMVFRGLQIKANAHMWCVRVCWRGDRLKQNDRLLMMFGTGHTKGHYYPHLPISVCLKFPMRESILSPKGGDIKREDL